MLLFLLKRHKRLFEIFSYDIISAMLILNPNNVNYIEKTILAYANESSYGNSKKHLELLKKYVFYPIYIQGGNINMIPADHL